MLEAEEPEFGEGGEGAWEGAAQVEVFDDQTGNTVMEAGDAEPRGGAWIGGRVPGGENAVVWVGRGLEEEEGAGVWVVGGGGVEEDDEDESGGRGVELLRF